MICRIGRSQLGRSVSSLLKPSEFNDDKRGHGGTYVPLLFFVPKKNPGTLEYSRSQCVWGSRTTFSDPPPSGTPGLFF